MASELKKFMDSTDNLLDKENYIKLTELISKGGFIHQDVADLCVKIYDNHLQQIDSINNASNIMEVEIGANNANARDTAKSKNEEIKKLKSEIAELKRNIALHIETADDVKKLREKIATIESELSKKEESDRNKLAERIQFYNYLDTLLTSAYNNLKIKKEKMINNSEPNLDYRAFVNLEYLALELNNRSNEIKHKI